jgi:DNA adenine methylase
MKDNGHRVFVSEYQMPKDFMCIWEKQVTNAMNQKNTYKPTERLFTL